MPRIREFRDRYMVNDIGAWVAGKLMRMKISQKEAAGELGITQQAMSVKIRSNSFTYEDMIKLFRMFESEDEEILKLMKIGG